MYLALVSGLMLVSCQKDQKVTEVKESRQINVTEMQAAFSQKYVEDLLQSTHSQEKVGPGWWEKVKKWVNDHTGTHLFDGCNYNNPCGPCPGMCLRANNIGGNDNNGSDVVTSGQYSQGLRAYGLSILQNSQTNEEEILFLFNKDLNDFTSNGYFYIEYDINLSPSLTQSMGKNSIKFIKGKYPVVFDNNTGYYYALVNSEMN